MNLGASHSQSVPLHARSSHRDTFGREQQMTPRHMSSLEPAASTVSASSSPRSQAMLTLRADEYGSPRKDKDGSRTSQRYSRGRLSESCNAQRPTYGDEWSNQPSRARPGTTGRHRTPSAHTTHHDAISHAPLQQQHTAQSAVDPMMFWMPPPPHIPAPSHARGASGLEDLSYHQRSAPQSYRRRTSSERGDIPIPGPSTTRARTRSLGRRASVSSSTTAVHGAPETPVEQEVEDPDEDPDIEEDKRRRNTAASGMHNQDFRLYAPANVGTIPIARFRAKKKQQVVRKLFGLPPNRPVLMGAVVFRPRACHIRLVESCR
jgi:hypothetical protein